MELKYYYIETKTKEDGKIFIGGAVCSNIHFEHFEKIVEEQNSVISMKMEIPKSLFNYIQNMGAKLEAKSIDSNDIEFRDLI